MKKFKIGDRVKVRYGAGFSAGSKGTVVSLKTGISHYDYGVLRDGASSSVGFMERELEPLPPEVSPSDVFAEVARSISIRQSATETAEQFVRRIWSAVELQRGVTP